jgi:hypothetical protein
MPKQLVARVKAKAKRTQMFRRVWFWALVSTAIVACALIRA